MIQLKHDIYENKFQVFPLHCWCNLFGGGGGGCERGRGGGGKWIKVTFYVFGPNFNTENDIDLQK